MAVRASDDDCAYSAPLCAKSPFDDYGFCTEGDCDPDDDQCPGEPLLEGSDLGALEAHEGRFVRFT